LNLQASKSLPDFKKDDQKAVDAALLKAIEAVPHLKTVDAALLKAIEAVPHLKTYLGARFYLRDGDKQGRRGGPLSRQQSYMMKCI
jgi:large subunit ribosomal protein L6e